MTKKVTYRVNKRPSTVATVFSAELTNSLLISKNHQNSQILINNTEQRQKSSKQQQYQVTTKYHQTVMSAPSIFVLHIQCYRKMIR